MNKPVSLSVVVVIGADRQRAYTMLDALQHQLAADQLEAIFVDLAPRCEPLALPGGNLRTCVVYPVKDASWGQALLTGFEAASASVVALLEDHCLPDRNWATMVIGAHREGWAAVAYAFSNGSPDTWLYRSIFMGEYGFWAVPASQGAAIDLPGNNLSYDRNALLSLGGSMEERLTDVGATLELMRQKGLATGVEARARVAHQASCLADVLQGHYSLARLSAAEKYKGRAWFHRVAMGTAALFLFAVLRAWRLFRSLHGRPGLRKRFFSALPVIILIYQWAAFGVAAGCFFGEGVSREEFERAQLNAPRISVENLE